MLRRGSNLRQRPPCQQHATNRRDHHTTRCLRSMNHACNTKSTILPKLTPWYDLGVGLFLRLVSLPFQPLLATLSPTRKTTFPLVHRDVLKNSPFGQKYLIFLSGLAFRRFQATLPVAQVCLLCLPPFSGVFQKGYGLLPILCHVSLVATKFVSQFRGSVFFCTWEAQLFLVPSWRRLHWAVFFRAGWQCATFG